MSLSVDIADLRFTPNEGGFLVTRPYPGGEAIAGQIPVTILESLREAWATHERDVMVPQRAFFAAYKTLRAERGERFARDQLRAVTGVDELGSVPRERFASATQALNAARQS